MLARIKMLFKALALTGALAFAAAALVTVADVTLRKFGTGIIGAVDLVQLFVVSGAFLAMPYAFAERAHIAVDIVLDVLPGRLKHWLAVGTSLLVVAFCAILAWYTCIAFTQVWQSADISMNLGIPMRYYWLPFSLGLFVSLGAVGIDIWRSLQGNAPKSEVFNEH